LEQGGKAKAGEGLGEPLPFSGRAAKEESPAISTKSNDRLVGFRNNREETG